VSGLPCKVDSPCHIGTCQGGTSCVDTLTYLPSGTPCGGGKICDASGQCYAPTCTFVPANPYNCVADDPCHRGHCFQTGQVCVHVPQDIDETAPDGQGCGTNFTNTCLGGECMVPNCTSSGKACSIGCANAAGKSLADQTPCGPSKFCAAGQCKPQLVVTQKNFTFVPGALFSGTVAVLSNLLTTEPGNALSVLISWGDGNQTAGILSGGSGSFAIGGEHVFALSGQATIRVDVSDPYTGASASVQFNVDTQTTEYPLGLMPWDITTGPDGNLWVGEDGGIARVTPTGIVTQFAVQGGGSIVVGPDSNLWYLGNQKVNRITPAGVTTQFPNASSGQPWSIASGSDGNLWITLNNTSNGIETIGRMTTAGVLQEFVVPTASAFLEGICAGPDGALWFTEYSANKIGRITTTGTISEFTIPTADTRPVWITGGSDGNVWFTEWTTGKIGRVTPTGTITEFPSMMGSNTLQNIAAGPDGRLWFTAYGVPFVGAITTSGVVTLVAIPSGSDADGVTTGPDQNIWYAERSGKRVARLVP
jgi:streptogramin lyase